LIAAGETDIGGLDEPLLIVEGGAAARVGALAAPVLRDVGLRLVRVKISNADGGTVQIMAERPDGSMTIEDCERANDALSPVFDVDSPFERPYRLEISSPGIDRPLVRASDFERAIGHEARIEMSRAVDGRKRYRGLIEAVESGAARIAWAPEESKETTVVALAIADMAEARLVLTDELVRATLRKEKAAKEADKREIAKAKLKPGKAKKAGAKRAATGE
jgi:ribosome maturation factor RimP